MSRSAALATLPLDPVAAPSEPPRIAAVFNLDDENERRIQKAIHTFYTDCDKLHAMKQGTVKGTRMVWTLGSFTPDEPRARTEWSVLWWTIDEISVRIQRCPDESAARATYANAGLPNAKTPGIKFPRR